ncbi:hypothetical protein BN1708_020599, partial [Verticillium longisporum]
QRHRHRRLRPPPPHLGPVRLPRHDAAHNQRRSPRDPARRLPLAAAAVCADARQGHPLRPVLPRAVRAHVHRHRRRPARVVGALV